MKPDNISAIELVMLLEQLSDITDNHVTVAHLMMLSLVTQSPQS